MFMLLHALTNLYVEYNIYIFQMKITKRFPRVMFNVNNLKYWIIVDSTMNA